MKNKWIGGRRFLKKGGTINQHMDKANQGNLISKMVKKFVVFQILKKGRPILDISLYK